MDAETGAPRCMAPIDLYIFDLDGTLYEDERVYARFIEELARFVPDARRSHFLRDWALAGQGAGPAQVGMGYDAAGDRLFRFRNGRITAFIDWNGRESPARDQRSHRRGAKPGEERSIETPLFDAPRFAIGDRWGLAGALAAHHGVVPADRAQAFLATRSWMRTPAYQPVVAEGLHATLHTLVSAGKTLVLMSNSPEDAVLDMVSRLTITPFFNRVVSEAGKPGGLALLLAARDTSRALSIGDNYRNDIEPALQAGSAAIFIDRHHTGAGEGVPGCMHVSSIEGALALLPGCV